jgi:hypothetical protein
MNIILGYDIVTYNGVLPNCLDPKFIPTIYEATKFVYNKSYSYFNEKWGVDYCVFNSNDYNNFSHKKSLLDIVNDRKNGKNYPWFYIIEPHSGLDSFFGKHPVHNKFVLDFISDVAIDEIVNYDGKLLINYTIDGGLGITTENFQRVVDYTRGKGISDEKVYLVFSDFKLLENFKNLNVNYNILNYDFYMKFKSTEFNEVIKNRKSNNSIVNFYDFQSSIGKDKKDFLLLTRHWKLHRLILLNKLHRLGLNNSLVSWEKSYYDQNLINRLIEHDHNLEFIDLITNTSKTIDVDDLINVKGIGHENKEMYLDTYISIVTESIFFQPDVKFPTGFLSEKIWKPIGHCHPFILVGPSKSLKHIKNEYGYMTFHPYIDESYDDIDDDYQRIKMIELEIDKFSKKTKEEKIEFLNNVKDICKFNQEKFLSYGYNTNESIKILKFLNGDILKEFI